MKKQFLILCIVLVIGNTIQAQTRAIKIGYIDMEYILQNVPNYTEAQNQLEQKAQEWKKQVETKKITINKLKDALKAEQALLTRELINERQAEINYLENENLDYQQKRFGPNGDLMLQKSDLTKPIQDQVFTAIQDIAEAKKYDFIFDKTSDLTMLFAAKRYDISDLVLRILNRSEKREQLTKKELAAEEAKELKEDAIDENPALAERKKILEDKKAARDKALEERKALEAQKKKEIEDRKKQLLIDREAKKSGMIPADSKAAEINTETSKETEKAAATVAKQKQADENAKKLEERKKAVEDRKKALEDKRKQMIEEREAKKTGTVSETKIIENSKAPVIATDSSKAIVPEKISVEDTKKKQMEARTKALEDRKKAIEDNKKALEEKKKKALQDREAIKKANEEKIKTTK